MTWNVLTNIACDVFNDVKGLWVPIRSVLTDGERFLFLEYRSDTASWFKSERVQGLEASPRNSTNFVLSVKRGDFAFLTQGS